MNETHQREAAIFDATVELPPEQRATYLNQACAGDAALRARIEALVKACDGTCEVDAPAANSLSPTGGEGQGEAAVCHSFEKPGDTIGRYKLLQKIGEGGCGVVYMAEQAEPVRRRVALKVIKLGMDTKSVIARFEAERQALALMEHPNIAKVLDAGATANGRPYFVMELVRGLKITDYCDEARLSTRGRLDLFIQVCHAIQHAHQKGIIHRDIKPSNILVTVNDGVPVPKVIDFGIAKATSGQQLTDKTLFTAFEQFIGTPAYMSPEQAVLTSVDIDTRSDIYALGVLLYELLTGKTPFDAKELLAVGFDEMRRTIREKEPARPSTRLSTLPGKELSTTAQRRGLDAPKLVSELRGDLDWIIMRCLEKDRARRYETTSALASDIQRHLNQQPVLACPPSALYRLKKFAQRKRRLLNVATAVILAILLGFGISRYFFAAHGGPGEIEIASEPAGAEVWIDGQNVGWTPVRLTESKPRNLTVALRLAQYEPLETSMPIGPRLQRKLVAFLKKVDSPPAAIAPSASTQSVSASVSGTVVTNVPAGPSAQPTPTNYVAIIFLAQGKVQFRRAGSLTWSEARTNETFFAGDELRTGLRSKALIRTDGSNSLRIGELTSIVFGTPRTGRTNSTFKTPQSSGTIRG